MSYEFYDIVKKYKGSEFHIGQYQYVQSIEKSLKREITEDEAYLLSRISRLQIWVLDNWLGENQPKPHYEYCCCRHCHVATRIRRFQEDHSKR